MKITTDLEIKQKDKFCAIYILKYNTLPYHVRITPDNSCEIKCDVDKHSGVLSHDFKTKIFDSTPHEIQIEPEE